MKSLFFLIMLLSASATYASAQKCEISGKVVALSNDQIEGGASGYNKYYTLTLDSGDVLYINVSQRKSMAQIALKSLGREVCVRAITETKKERSEFAPHVEETRHFLYKHGSLVLKAQ